MATVRDTLKDEKSARNQSAQDLGLGESSGLGQGASGPGELGKGQDQDELITARLREAADQRAALAQTEINKLQNHIEQLQQRMEELAKLKLPPGNLPAELEDAKFRLDDANADLARANEAKQNTELTSSLRQEHHAPSLHVDHTTHQSVGGSGAPKVGAVIGRDSAQPKVPQRKQHSHGVR